MITLMVKRFVKTTTVSALIFLGGVMLTPTHASAAAPGLAVVIGNSYEGYLPGSPRDAGAVADTLEKNGFVTVRMLSATGSEIASEVARLAAAVAAAGPTRIVYMSGFGMCFNDDLVLFAEDIQPEQFKSGKIGDVAISLSVVAETVAAGAEHALVVFDTNPRQCTRDMVDALKLPKNTVLLITTGIGGDVIDEIDEGGMSAFATAFVDSFDAKQPVDKLAADLAAQIRTMTEGQQVPIVVGKH